MDLIDYILLLLAFPVFLFPKRIMGFYAMLVVLGLSVRNLLGIFNSLFSFSMPLTIQFTPVAAVFALALVIVAVSVSIYSYGYIREYLSEKSHVETAFHMMNFILLYISMTGVLTAEDNFRFLFFWEMMSLSSFALVLWNREGGRRTLHAAIGYLVLMHIGFFFIFFGFMMLPYSEAGLMGYGAMPMYVWILFFIGFGIKVGIFPLHGWLPVAHPAAPSHVSAMMSAAMLNIGLYGIFRATLYVSDLFTAGIIIFIVGTLTALYGAYRSAVESNLKALFAYSSMDNMGMILIGIGMGTIGKATGSHVMAFSGYCGALIHMLCHSSFKSVLFMCSGSIQQSCGTLDLDSMGGLMKKMHMTGIAFLIAALSAMSIPPLSGFVGEFVLLGGAFFSFMTSHNIIVALIGVVVISLTAGSSIMAMSKAYSRSMLSTPRVPLKREPHEVNGWMNLGIAVALFFILFGIYIFPVTVLGHSAVICGVYEPALTEILHHSLISICVLGLLLTAIVVVLYMLRNRFRAGEEKRSTWMCGASDVPSMTQYGATSFSAEISADIVRDTSNGMLSDKATHGVNHVLLTFLHSVTGVFPRMQSGKVYHYVFHALIFIVIIALLSLLGF